MGIHTHTLHTHHTHIHMVTSRLFQDFDHEKFEFGEKFEDGEDQESKDIQVVFYQPYHYYL